jgi:heparanase 1
MNAFSPAPWSGLIADGITAYHTLNGVSDQNIWVMSNTVYRYNNHGIHLSGRGVHILGNNLTDGVYSAIYFGDQRSPPDCGSNFSIENNLVTYGSSTGGSREPMFVNDFTPGTYTIAKNLLHGKLHIPDFGSDTCMSADAPITVPALKTDSMAGGRILYFASSALAQRDSASSAVAVARFCHPRGYGLTDCNPVDGDRVQVLVRWGLDQRLAALAGEPVQLDIRMSGNCTLFGARVADYVDFDSYHTVDAHIHMKTDDRDPFECTGGTIGAACPAGGRCAVCPKDGLYRCNCAPDCATNCGVSSVGSDCCDGGTCARCPDGSYACHCATSLDECDADAPDGRRCDCAHVLSDSSQRGWGASLFFEQWGCDSLDGQPSDDSYTFPYPNVTCKWSLMQVASGSPRGDEVVHRRCVTRQKLQAGVIQGWLGRCVMTCPTCCEVNTEGKQEAITAAEFIRSKHGDWPNIASNHQFCCSLDSKGTRAGVPEEQSCVLDYYAYARANPYGSTKRTMLVNASNRQTKDCCCPRKFCPRKLDPKAQDVYNMSTTCAQRLKSDDDLSRGWGSAGGAGSQDWVQHVVVLAMRLPLFANTSDAVRKVIVEAFDPDMSVSRSSIISEQVQQQTCELQLLPGVIIGPASYQNIGQCASVAACCAACGSSSSCQAFTYETVRKECYLKNSTVGGGGGHRGAVSGRRPPPPLPPPVVTLRPGVVHTIDRHYKSWNIDASPNRQWDTRNLSEPLLHYLANGSEPGLLRFGGSGNDGLDYGIGMPCPPHGRCFNVSHFTRFMNFAVAAGSRLVFGLNMNPRNSTGFWDDTQARAIIVYAQVHGFGDIFWGFELGNEVTGEYTPRKYAQNLLVLQALLVDLFPDAASRPKVVGPDIILRAFKDPNTTVSNNAALRYLAEFAANCSALGVDLYAVTHHEYLELAEYPTAPPPAAQLDEAGTMARAVVAAVNGSVPGLKVWAGETGPHPGRSPGCDHSSLRWSNWGDTFWYVDAMCQKALHGYDMFCRQDFVGIDYGLVDCATLAPLPDYYAGIVWAKTMGTKVLSVSSTNSSSGGIRAYAHCTAGSAMDATVVLINLANTSWPNAELAIAGKSQPAAVSAMRYTFTGPSGTNSSVVALNGGILSLDESQRLPTLDAVKETLHFDATTERLALPMVPAESVQFIVLQGVGAALGCGSVSTTRAGGLKLDDDEIPSGEPLHNATTALAPTAPGPQLLALPCEYWLVQQNRYTHFPFLRQLGLRSRSISLSGHL